MYYLFTWALSQCLHLAWGKFLRPEVELAQGTRETLHLLKSKLQEISRWLWSKCLSYFAPGPKAGWLRECICRHHVQVSEIHLGALIVKSLRVDYFTAAQIRNITFRFKTISSDFQRSECERFWHQQMIVLDEKRWLTIRCRPPAGSPWRSSDCIISSIFNMIFNIILTGRQPL